jgi:hypothetical protein
VRKEEKTMPALLMTRENSNHGAHVRTESLPSIPDTELDFTSVQTCRYDIPDMYAVASSIKDGSFRPQTFVQIDSSELIWSTTHDEDSIYGTEATEVGRREYRGHRSDSLRNTE